MSESQLSTVLVATWPQSASCAASVTGFANGTKVDLIIMFFESPRHSGGGPVKELFYDDQECSAVVTYHSLDGSFLVAALFVLFYCHQ